MRIEQIRVFKPHNNIQIPKRLFNGKHICFFPFLENDNFMDEIDFIPFSKSTTSRVVVPKVKSPVSSFMTSEYRKKIIHAGYIPYSGNWKIVPKQQNFYYDSSIYLEKLLDRWKPQRYASGKGYYGVNTTLKLLENVDSERYERVVIYMVNTDKPFVKDIFKRKIYPYLTKVRDHLATNGDYPLEFDKLLLMQYSKTTRKFMMLFDKESDRNSFSRVKTIILNITSSFKEDKFKKVDTEDEYPLTEPINMDEEHDIH